MGEILYFLLSQCVAFIIFCISLKIQLCYHEWSWIGNLRKKLLKMYGT